MWVVLILLFSHIVSLKMLCLLAFSLLGAKLKFSDYTYESLQLNSRTKGFFNLSPHGTSNELTEIQAGFLPITKFAEMGRLGSMPTIGQCRNLCTQKGGNETYEAVATLFKETYSTHGKAREAAMAATNVSRS
jgi:hypothetical protein